MDADDRISDLTQSLEEALDQGKDAVRSILTSLLQTAADAMDATESSLFRPDENDHLYFYASTNPDLMANKDIKPIPIGGSIAGFVYITGQTIAREDAGEAKDHFGEIDRAMKYKTREYMAAPVVSGDSVLGVMSVVNRRESSDLGKFTEGEIMLAERLGRACGVVLNHVDRVERQTEATKTALLDGAGMDSEAAAIRARIDMSLGDLSDADLELIRDLSERLAGASPEDEY